MYSVVQLLELQVDASVSGVVACSSCTITYLLPHVVLSDLLFQGVCNAVAVCCTQFGAADSLKVCARCQDAVYCSKMCQRRDWLVHKSECKCIAAMKGTVKAVTR
jgi:MYND finger